MILDELVETYTGEQVTNNTCELGAVLLVCQHVLDHPELGTDVTIVSDSEYVVKGATIWLPKWQSRNWKTTTGPVKNKVLWEAIAYLKTQLNLKFEWVKGHGESALNNRADELAVQAYTKVLNARKSV